MWRIISNAILNKIITNNDLSSSLDLIEKIEPQVNDFKKNDYIYENKKKNYETRFVYFSNKKEGLNKYSGLDVVNAQPEMGILDNGENKV